MNQPHQQAATPKAVSRGTLELIVAGVLFAVGSLVVIDSLRLGSGWSSDGPQAGYFPFYIGSLLCLVSALIAASSWRNRELRRELFLNAPQLRLVLRLLIPLTVYVALLRFTGIYVASWLFMGFFMWRSAEIRWWTTALISSTTVVVLFAMFELWFKVPLPKGPLELWLGLA
jgi:putative tricarboxylic transport membrane protein